MFRALLLCIFLISGCGHASVSTDDMKRPVQLPTGTVKVETTAPVELPDFKRMVVITDREAGVKCYLTYSLDGQGISNSCVFIGEYDSENDKK